jgi:hypothetical protein
MTIADWELAMKHLFVSKVGDLMVGFVHLVEDGPQAARVTVIRVAVEWSHTSVPVRLMRTVHSYCRSRGFLTLTLEASAVPRSVLRALNRGGFSLVQEGHQQPHIDCEIEQNGGVPAEQTRVRILLQRCTTSSISGSRSAVTLPARVGVKRGPTMP